MTRAATSRLLTGQAVVAAFARSGIPLPAHTRFASGVLRGVMVVDMTKAEAAHLGFDAGALIFPSVTEARSQFKIMGDEHSSTGGFIRRVDNVLVLVTPWTESGVGGLLRKMPSSVAAALVRLQSSR